MRKIYTADGSFTLYDENFDENYHSITCGALSETMQKHVIPAFEVMAEGVDELNILDICFGLGFNTLSAVAYAKIHYPHLKLNIFSPEINEPLVRSLKDFEYPVEIQNNELISSVVDRLRFDDGRYSVEVAIGDAREILNGCDKKFDIVFQDAFSPAKNRSLWSAEYFKAIVSLMSPKAALTTYSRSNAVRMGMHEAGLNIYEIEHKNIRHSTFAANFEVANLKKIDMLAKIKNAPNTKPIRDTE